MEKTPLNRLHASGAYKGGTDYLQSVGIVAVLIVHNRWIIAKLHNKPRIKQYYLIHLNGSGRLVSFVILDLLTHNGKTFRNIEV